MDRNEEEEKKIENFWRDTTYTSTMCLLENVIKKF